MKEGLKILWIQKLDYEGRNGFGNGDDQQGIGDRVLTARVDNYGLIVVSSI